MLMATLSAGCVFRLDQPPRIQQIGIGIHGPGEAIYRNWSTDCLHLHRYDGELLLDRRTIPFRAGSASFNAANTTFGHRWPTTDCRHLVVHFHAVSRGGGARAFPWVRALNEEFESVFELAAEAIGWMRTSPARAQARVWEILWRLAGDAVEGPGYPLAVEKAIRIIESELHEEFSVPDLARRLDISRSHLLRMFRQHLQCGVAEYVRQCRVERAQQLLARSSLSVKEVAYAVGIADLQHFNKTIRATTGFSPREYRQKGDE